jgi:hypothetical protein
MKALDMRVAVLVNLFLPDTAAGWAVNFELAGLTWLASIAFNGPSQ